MHPSERRQGGISRGAGWEGGCVSSQGLGLEARGARLWEGSGCRVSATAQAPPATVGVAGAGRGQPGLLRG